ncbi:unnamed protein product [Callosobruchus maculatus]|uniref:Uncharacterized protein n=1 Tax=Callosobruchus maculatus TaxID=64391 RepID=A0A653C4U3_CALMS|nr:unnamed protein product [Callosobruchus maculatus]
MAIGGDWFIFKLILLCIVCTRLVLGIPRPKSEKLSAVSALSDIPATIKDALQEISPNFGGK